MIDQICPTASDYNEICKVCKVCMGKGGIWESYETRGSGDTYRTVSNSYRKAE